MQKRLEGGSHKAKIVETPLAWPSNRLKKELKRKNMRPTEVGRTRRIA
jgi:hypothetical protein